MVPLSSVLEKLDWPCSFTLPELKIKTQVGITQLSVSNLLNAECTRCIIWNIIFDLVCDQNIFKPISFNDIYEIRDAILSSLIILKSEWIWHENQDNHEKLISHTLEILEEKKYKWAWNWNKTLETNIIRHALISYLKY
ncbi:MAG: hypothetical protein ACD_4C00115G0003 [uncultured bacterium (gcode 4)]|uniref:Uncharacterized protein n=1 Tax=uncultured bacterium (gcode 4) TaxID=1234023 RepID=K2FYF3_9BACT|nr:MAG: hypothetical protein ACD_4C00115G0003 [uncultured bacterium (gcode 4)]